MANVLSRSATQTIDASRPMEVAFGTVMSISPHIIMVNPKIYLQESQIVLTKNVIDYDVEMTPVEDGEHYTDLDCWNDDDEKINPVAVATHKHKYIGKKKFTVHNSLEIGDNVLMLRSNNGQKYVVLEKIFVK